MSAKTKAQLLADIEALKKRVIELQAVENEPHQKNGVSKKQAHTLVERVKELDCLYGISRIVETPGVSLPEIFQGCVELLPPAWQYPQTTCARITLYGQEYKSGNFHETKWKLASEIKVGGKDAGSVEVFYLEGRPKEYEGPLLKEERALIDAVAERLGRIIHRVQAQEKVAHLTLVLRAIRNVNQLIIREKKRDVLIQKVCETLTETRGYSTAWVILFDERGKYLDSAESGLGKGFTPLLKELKQGKFPACVRQAQSRSKPITINDPSSTCADCTITDIYSDKGRMTVQLEHAKKVYGVLSVSFGTDVAVDEEELSLFDEVAGDITFALYNIELENKREQAEKEIISRERFISDTFNAIQDGISVLDKDLSVLRVNSVMEKLYANQMPFVGKKCYQVYQGRKTICPWCPSKPALEDGNQHMAIVPYPNEEDPSGWIELTSYPLPDVSGKITGVIEFVKDITERVQAEQEFKLLLDLSRQASTETKLDDLLFFIANQIVKIIPPAETSSIFLYDEKRKVIRVQAWAGFNDSEIEGLEFAIDGHQVGRLFQTKKPAMIKDVSKDPEFELVDKPSLKLTKSQIIMPLIYKKRVIGILFADSLIRTDAFSQKDLDLLESIGNQLAGVIENARLLDQVIESEEQYHSVVEDSPGHICRFKPGFIITFVNETYCQYFGKKSEELVGMNFLDLIPKEDRESIMSNFISLSQESPILTHEHKVIKDDGEIRWMRWTNHALFNEKGKLTSYQSFGEDITESRQAQRAIQQERDKAQKYLDIAEVMIVAIDKDGEITLVNQKGASILGYKIEELIGKNWFNTCVPTADRKQTKKSFDEFIAGGVALGDHFEQTVITRSGKERIIDWHSTPLWEWDDEEKHRIGSLNSGEDITERKMADKKLRQSEKQYQSVVEDSPGVINRFTPDGTIIFANQEYCRFFGKEYDQLIGMNIQSVIPEESRESVMSYIGSLTQESPIKTFENKVIRHDGKIRWMRWADHALFDDAGQIFSIQSFGQDITRMVEAEQELRLEQEKAQKYLDIAGVVLVALNRKGEITLINQKGSQILGYQEDELIGVNWFDTCLPEWSRKEVKQVFRKLMAGDIELVEFYENPILTRSGEERIIAWHNTCLRDDKNSIIGTLTSGEDITKRKRAEQLLNALNRAAVSMGAARTQQEIFNAVARELKQIDISCMLFPVDESGSKLLTKYISPESAALRTAEKLVGIAHEDFSIAIDSIDSYWKMLSKKNTVFIEDLEKNIRQILPKFSRKLIVQLINMFEVPKSIAAPLVVENKVIGLFSIQSDTLTREDVPAATAFADQLSSAWNKIGLLQNLRKTVEGTIHTIAATVEARDPYTAGHQTRVADLAAAIASEMKLTDDQVEGIKMAGIIHDLGKVQIPAEILSKPGKISELEYKIIQTHPQVGFDLLKEIEFPWPIAEMVLQHHEKMDGSGYPQGLKGDEIMIEARILAVSDIVEAMSSHRPYRPAHGIEEALAQIKQDKGTLLDPDVVNACLKIFKEGYELL